METTAKVACSEGTMVGSGASASVMGRVPCVTIGMGTASVLLKVGFPVEMF